MPSNSMKLEYRTILDWVNQNSSVLDLGCGDGELLSLLIREKKVKAQGIELSEQAIYACVAKGLNILHGDIDTGLSEYASHSFDYVILDQSFQQVKKPDIVLDEALRVGNRAIVGFPNFAHYTVRYALSIKGKTPVTPSLPYLWYETPNLHFFSILDFIEYCSKRKITVENVKYIAKDKSVHIFPNLLAQIGLFLLKKE